MTIKAWLATLPRRWALLLVSVLGLVLWGASEAPAASGATAGSAILEAAPEGKEEPAEVEEEDEKDYWASVKFDRLRFREIQEMVRLHYIDPGYDRAFAFQRAAGFALASLEEGLELLPAPYLKAGRKDPELKKKLAGKTKRLKDGDEFLVLEHVEGWNKDRRRRMSDDEILAERVKRQRQYEELKKAWKDVGFSRGDMERVMSFALDRAKKKKIRPDELWIAAAQGYLAALDPHSTIISKEAWQDSTEEIRDASFEGVGALLTQRYDDIIVESPIDGQPAALAGLRAGDIIVKVDGRDVRGKPLTKVVKMIRGPKGTQVVLAVQRVGVPNDLDIAIVRSFIAIKNVTPSLMGPEHTEFGLIKVRGFIQGTSRELREAIARLERQSATGRLRGLVLDLRNNSGGLLQEAVRMSDVFLPRGTVVSVRSRSAEDETHEAEAGRDILLPLVVLVDDGSASAAEIVASALQENHRAVILGDRTFGKATVQSLLPPVLGEGYFVKLTVARYYGPSDHTLQVHGVHPDVEVPPDVDGKMPLGFREENLYDHLPEVPARQPPGNADLVKGLKPCVEATSVAEKVQAANPNPVIKFDFPLFKAGDYLECMAASVADSAHRPPEHAR
jgi:C-terminal peptidase prc